MSRKKTRTRTRFMKSEGVNSRTYWDGRFQTDWEQRGGPDQTRFFADVFFDGLPEWINGWLAVGTRTFLDVACAQGQASVSVAARFPSLRYLGVDFAAAGIAKARAAHPDVEFRVISEDWDDLPKADVLYCSNTLEHLPDWRERIGTLCEHARSAVCILVPYREAQLEPEHVARFEVSCFPVSSSDHRLLFLKVIDTSVLPHSRWNGRQALVVYGRANAFPRRGRHSPIGDLGEGLDLRSLPAVQCKEILSQQQDIESAVPTRPDTGDTMPAMNDIDRVNAEWKAKFEAMVAEFSQKYSEMAAHHETEIRRFRDERENSRQEHAVEIARLLRERDGALNNAVLLEQKFALTEELRSQQIVYLEGVVDRETRRHTVNNTAELERLLALRNQETAVLTDEISSLNERMKGLVAELERERSCHAEDAAAKSAEIMRLTELKSNLAADVDNLRLMQERAITGHAAQASRLAAERSMALEQKRDLENQLASLSERHSQELKRIEVATETALSGLQAENARCLQELESVKTESADHRAESARMAEASRAEIAALQSKLAAAEGLVVAFRDTADAAGQRGEIDAVNTRSLRVDYETRFASLSSQLHDLRGECARLVDEYTSQPFRNGSAAAKAIAAIRTILEGPVPGVNKVASAASGENETGTVPVSPNGCPPRGTYTHDHDVVAMQLEVFDTGGLERVVFDLCCGLRDAGKKTLVLCRRGGSLGDRLRGQGIAVHTFDGSDAYRELLREHRVTHLFLHHSYFGFDLASSLGIRVFDVVHNTYFWKARQPAEVHRVGHHGAGVVCVSSAVRDFHSRVFDIPLSKIIVINNPINTEGLILPDPDQLRNIRQKAKHVTFLNVANLYPAKAQLPMLSAFAEASTRHAGMRLLIAGAEADATIAQELRRLIDELALRQSVLLLGSCGRREIGSLYARCHAFVLPSIYEGYSVSAVEAAAYGLPLILTDVGGARDLIQANDCGILLPPLIDDLTRCDGETMRRLAMTARNQFTPVLADAFYEVATHREEWLERGFLGRAKLLPLAHVVRRYLDVMRSVVAA